MGVSGATLKHPDEYVAVNVKVTNKTAGAAAVAINGGAYGVMGVWYNGKADYFTVNKDQTHGPNNEIMRHGRFTVKVKIDGVEQCAVDFTAATENEKNGDDLHLYFNTQGLFHEKTHECLTVAKPFKTYTPFFLASTTDREYDKAVSVVLKAGGENSTGVQQDMLNKDVLYEKKEWKKGMFAKWFQCIDKLSRLYPGKEIIALCIAGGPACDWERTQMTSPASLPQVEEIHMRSKFPNIRLFVGTSSETLDSFIRRGLPLSECM